MRPSLRFTITMAVTTTPIPATPATPSAPKKIHRAWLILAVLAVAQGVGQSISMAAGIMVAPLNDPDGIFGWNMGLIGAALATYYLCGALAAPITGMLGDRYGARPMMLACGILYAVSMIMIGTVTHLWQFFLYFGVLLSVTQSLAMVPILASVNGWFKQRLGLATGLLWASVGIGAAIVAPVIVGLLNAGGWQTTFTIIGLGGGGARACGRAGGSHGPLHQGRAHATGAAAVAATEGPAPDGARGMLATGARDTLLLLRRFP